MMVKCWLTSFGEQCFQQQRRGSRRRRRRRRQCGSGVQPKRCKAVTKRCRRHRRCRAATIQHIVTICIVSLQNSWHRRSLGWKTVNWNFLPSSLACHKQSRRKWGVGREGNCSLPPDFGRSWSKTFLFKRPWIVKILCLWHIPQPNLVHFLCRKNKNSWIVLVLKKIEFIKAVEFFLFFYFKWTKYG